MGTPIYNDRDKIAAIEFCKKHIETNGYCSVLYATEQAAPGKTFKSNDHKAAFLKSVASLITKSGKYQVKYRYANGNHDIEENPDYKEKGYFERHATLEKIFIAFLSGIVSLIVGYILLLSKAKDLNRLEYKQDSTASRINGRLDTLQKHIKDFETHYKQDSSRK